MLKSSPNDHFTKPCSQQYRPRNVTVLKITYGQYNSTVFSHTLKYVKNLHLQRCVCFFSMHKIAQKILYPPPQKKVNNFKSIFFKLLKN